MWISKRRDPGHSPSAMVGRATIPGDPAGVYLDGERRSLPVFGPGGYHWRPALGQEVLVLKGEGESSYVAGARCGVSLEPGEVCIRAGEAGAQIRLLPDGTLELRGRVLVNGVPLAEGQP